METKRKACALCLMSGGLDSLLAVSVLKEQDVEMVGITFTTPFFGAKRAEKGARELGIRLIIQDLTKEHLLMLKSPAHGFGKRMNPCIDCHALMVRKAGEVLLREGFDFIATGEVLGERPMSQNRQSLDVVARDSGAGDLLLRPLSAKFLPPTRPELAGLIDRERLFAIEGRSRKPQMALAEKFGIKHYEQPAGGCLLTDPHFSARLAELLKMNPGADLADVELLKCGRHFRFPSGAKAIVGRDARDNEKIAGFGGRGTLISPDVIPGPTVLLADSSGGSDVEIAAALCASYSDNGGNDVAMEIADGQTRTKISSRPRPRSEFNGMKI